MSGRSVQVFEYLLALKNLMVPAVRGLQDYKDIYWWQNELPIGEGCLLNPRTKTPEAWLEVYKSSSPSAPEDLKQVRIERLYGELFALYQRLQREGDNAEIIWGHGLLT